MTLTLAESLESLAGHHWDLYKDAHGVRPRGLDTSNWTVEDFEKAIEQLNDLCAFNNRREAEAHKLSIAAFEERIGKLISMGAKDRETAIRWMHDAEGTGGDPDSLCYAMYLPWGYFNK